MANGIAPSPNSSHDAPRPPLTSYDSGYEFSLDRYVDVKLLLQNADEASDVPATYASAS